MPKEVKDPLQVLPIRVPTSTRNAIASSARRSNMNVSEFLRWFLDHAFNEQAGATYDLIGKMCVEKYGQEVADMLEQIELKRMEYLVNGDAVETSDGRDITFVKPKAAPEKATTAEPERAAV